MITASSGSRLVMKVTTQSPQASVSWRLQLAQSMVTLMSHTVETPYDSQDDHTVPERYGGSSRVVVLWSGLTQVYD